MAVRPRARRKSRAWAKTGVRVRHSRSCTNPQDRDCPCDPGFEAWVYLAEEGRKARQTFPTFEEARRWRLETLRRLYQRKQDQRGAVARATDLDEAYSLIRKAMVRADRAASIAEPPSRAYVHEALDLLHKAEHAVLIAIVERS